MSVLLCTREVGTTVGLDDPRSIGCWWLGYVIVAVGLTATSVPLWFFPSSLTQRQPNELGAKTPEHKTNRQASIWRKLWKEIKGTLLIDVCE